MGRITLELVRKRAEHNEGEIKTLEELALHQEKLTKIENLDKWCRGLKVLLLQNNSISKLENLSRLKCLEYLNLAMNNIEVIEGLEGCENLKKLDLTLNFVGKLSTVALLQKNTFLEQLYLVGNPCTDFEGYREYIIATLPQLTHLDGAEITKTEKIQARQVFSEIEPAIKELEEKHMKKREAEKKVSAELDPNDDDKFWNTPSANTPEVRAQILKKLEDDEIKKNSSSTEPKNEKKPRKLFNEEGKPFNINEGKYSFSLNDEVEKGIILVDIGIPKHMDSSLLELDVQPNYIRVLIKKKIFQLVLPEEIKPDNCYAQRSQITGHLVVTMPKLNQDDVIKFHKRESQNSSKIHTKPAPDDLKQHGAKAVKRNQNASPISGNGNPQNPRRQYKYLNKNDKIDETDVPPLV